MIDCQTILDSISDGLYTVNPERQITYWNKAAEVITGYCAGEVKGRFCHDGPLKHVDSDGNELCSLGCPLSWSMAHGRTYEADIFLHHREGHRVPVRVKVSPLYDSGNQVVGAVELFSDNTEQMLALERIAELEEAALLDPVTHLANKTYLEFQTQRYLREMVRQVQHVGILLIVIDQFEELCRPLAEAARNQLLQIVAETIRSNGRPLDLFGHVDDGCFVGLLHDVTSQQLYAVARKHHALIEKSHFFTGDQIIDAKVSIGGTMLRMDDTFQAAISRCEKQLMVSHRADGVCQISVELPFDA